MKTRRFSIGGQVVQPGETKTISLAVARNYDFSDMRVPVRVVRGREPGPTLFVSAAIHGDELNGVEIIKRLLVHKSLKRLQGTLIAVPIVNVFGFSNGSRYLPDRRDLNRSFPGSSRGSLASRLAHVFMKEIVKKSTHGIDFHTGAIHRSNLPQIRASLENDVVRDLARNFGAPVVLDSKLRDGSLREAARRSDIPILLFEGGEALRMNEQAIRIGLKGVLATMSTIGMIARPAGLKVKKGLIASGSDWIRAPQSGTIRMLKKQGNRVKIGEPLATISDPFGDNAKKVLAPFSGLIIGINRLPLVNQGDALLHIASFDSHAILGKVVDLFDQENQTGLI